MRNTLRVNVSAALALTGVLWAMAPDSPVADAAMRGDVESVRSLLKHGADVNAAQGDGMTALHWAAVNGDVETAEILIYAGAGVDAQTRLGSYTPLHLASREGHAEVLKSLLAAGVDVNALTSTGGVAALHFSAAAGDVEAIKALVKHGAELDKAESVWGHTPLIFAAAKNRAEAVTVLLHSGADPVVSGRVIDIAARNEGDRAEQKARNERLGLTPVYRSYRDSVPDPPGAGALPVMRRPDEIGRYGGLTALTVAARDGSVETVKALVNGGADINQVTAGDHSSPLLMAAINGQFSIAMMLLERGADPNLVSESGDNPLFATISRQWLPEGKFPHSSAHLQQQTTYLELMEALLEAGADVNARLEYNIWHMELGANLLRLDWVGATAFIRAAHALDVDAMKLLVRSGADPHIAIKRPASRRGARDATSFNYQQDGVEELEEVPIGAPGVFPIHVVTGYSYADSFVGNAHRHVENGWMPAVKYLVEELGADVLQPDYYGMTPLHNAASRGDNEMVLYLLKQGTDPHALDRRGRTTVDVANGPHQRMQPYPETITLLEGIGVRNNHMCLTC
jgi:ankyrin repeat protein